MSWNSNGMVDDIVGQQMRSMGDQINKKQVIRGREELIIVAHSLNMYFLAWWF